MLGLLGSEEKWSKLPRLVKIRNPWGNSFEWRVSLESPPNMTNTCQGRWSDQHITGNSKLSIEEKQSLVTGVGEWWMLYDDFTKCFTHLTICHPEPEPEQRQTKVAWKETSFEVASQLLVLNVHIIESSLQGSWNKQSGGSGTATALDGGVTALLSNPQFRFSLTKDGTHEVHRQQVRIRDDTSYSR